MLVFRSTLERKQSEVTRKPKLCAGLGASETTNRGVSSDHRSRKLLPCCLTTDFTSLHFKLGRT